MYSQKTSDYMLATSHCQTISFNAVIEYTLPWLELGVKVMVFDATFNNISVISWWSVLLVEETRVPGETQ